MADIGAVKAKTVVTTPTEVAPSQSGKPPTHVFDAVMTAMKMIDTLSASAGSNS